MGNKLTRTVKWLPLDSAEMPQPLVSYLFTDGYMYVIGRRDGEDIIFDDKSSIPLCKFTYYADLPRIRE